jgi:hypothetical protein
VSAAGEASAAAEVLLAPGRTTYRGALHCHSTFSDGQRSPREVLEAYGAAGWDFVSITDHYEAEYDWGVLDPPTGIGPLALRGLELASGPFYDPGTIWINAVGVPPGFGGPHEPLDSCRALAEAGAYLTVVHPGLNQQRRTDLPALDYVDAVEIYTQSVRGMWPDQGHGSYYAEALLAEGRRVLLNAADDAHFFHPRDRFVGRVEVQAEELREEAILAALKAGRYYSSTGPRIHSLVVEGERLTIACEPCYSIVCGGDGAHWGEAQRVFAAEEAVVETPFAGAMVTISSRPDHLDGETMVASFDLAPFRGSYCRVTVLDDQGRSAWTNPVWV